MTHNKRIFFLELSSHPVKKSKKKYCIIQSNISVACKTISEYTNAFHAYKQFLIL